MRISKPVLVLILALIGVQLIDALIHIATGQAELSRVLANAILGLWALSCFNGGRIARSWAIAFALYLTLNGYFVAVHGMTNPQNGGELRVPLVILVCVSAVLVLWLRSKIEQD